MIGPQRARTHNQAFKHTRTHITQATNTHTSHTDIQTHHIHIYRTRVTHITHTHIYNSHFTTHTHITCTSPRSRTYTHHISDTTCTHTHTHTSHTLPRIHITATLHTCTYKQAGMHTLRDPGRHIQSLTDDVPTGLASDSFEEKRSHESSERNQIATKPKTYRRPPGSLLFLLEERVDVIGEEAHFRLCEMMNF